MRPRLLRTWQATIPQMQKIITRVEFELDQALDTVRVLRTDNDRLRTRAAESGEALLKVNAELAFLYDELRLAQQQPLEHIRHRVMQLAARVNPEGRQYEGPEAL